MCWHVYGTNKVWHLTNLEGIDVADRTVEQHMKHLNLQSALRSRRAPSPCPDAYGEIVFWSRLTAVCASSFTFAVARLPKLMAVFVSTTP